MSEWKEYKLGEVAEIVTGYPFPSKKYEATGKLRVVRGENVTIGKLRWDVEKHWDLDIAELEKYLLRPDDIVIGMDGSRVGSNRALIREADLPLILAQRVSCLRAQKGFDSKYIWYTIFSDTFRKYVEAINTGTSIPHISQKQIAEFEIMCPSEAEQKRIAGVLSSLDDKINLLNRENATLEALAETLFRHYFIDNPDPTWKEGKLGEFINIGSGKALKHNDFVNEGLYPVLGANGEIGRANEYLVNETDRVLYTGRVGTLGKVFRLEGERAWLSDNTLVIKPKCHFNYVYFLLKQANLQDLDVGSTQPLIRQSDVVDIDVIIPNDSIIDAFEKEVCPLFEKIKSNQQQIQTLAIQRDSLLPRLMTGEVKISGQYNIGK